MSTLKVNKIRDTAGSADSITLDPNGGAVLAGVTTVTSVKVGAAVTITESGIEASGIGITCANINGTQIGGRRNIVINGAMQVAQRSTSTVAVSDGTNEGYQTLDRFKFTFGNSAVGAANISQSTDAPTTLGFTKSHKTDVTTVNTTASGQEIVNLTYRIEGQDLRNSGWNHLSSSSFLTLSFYFKTTKTGNSKLPIMFRTRHGTNYYYVQNVTVTDPTNWNRYTVTIPGNSNLQIDDANTVGMDINFTYYSGPDKDTGSEASWGSTNAYSTSDSTNYFDSTSNDMFITGVQLEVGSQATAFEHRSFGEEERLCQRYYQKLSGDNLSYFGNGNIDGGNQAQILVDFITEMRTAPTSLDTSGTAGHYYIRVTTNATCTSVPTLSNRTTKNALVEFFSTSHGFTSGHSCFGRSANADAFLGFSAEL